jgi:sugar phosphate isomerase/epimerase
MTIAFACSSWSLTKPPYDDRGDGVFATVSRSGFAEIELPVLAPDDVLGLTERTGSLRESAERHGLRIGRLSLFEPITRGLLAREGASVERARALFADILSLAQGLGASSLTLRAPWPAGITTPTLTPPEYFYINVPDMPGPGYVEADYQPDWRYETKFRIGIPDRVDWAEEFELFVRGLSPIVADAAERGITIELENQYGTLVPHTDTLLRVFDRIPARNLTASFNVSQAFLQRELLHWSIRKLTGRIGHVRVADGDGLACYNLPPGAGTLDFPGIAEALAEIDFDGTLTCTWLNDVDAAANLEAGRQYLDSLVSRTR